MANDVVALWTAGDHGGERWAGGYTGGVADLFGGDPIGLAASGISGKCGNARKASDDIGEARCESDDEIDDDDE